jgi:carbamate kinase
VGSSETSKGGRIRIAIYAIGGNALSNPKGGDIKAQSLALAKVLSDIVDLLESGYRVVVTHGNGPQVGDLLMLEERATRNDSKDISASTFVRKRIGLDSWVAATQGMIGHELALNLESVLHRRARPERTAVVLTRVEVNPSDPAFDFPTKPIGPILSDKAVMSEDWDIAATANGARRVVASPKPISILDSELIHTLVREGAVVFCGGGGGIPVIRKESHWVGIPAVIDKDRLSALLAIELNADLFVISTAIDSLRINFGQPNEEVLTQLTCQQAEAGVSSGEFPAGSMGPKVEAMAWAKISLPECKVLMCQPGDAMKAVRGITGTTLQN